MAKIAIIFTDSMNNKTEDIKCFEGVKRRFCEIITQEEIKNNPGILKEYAGMLDCTNESIFYNGAISKKTGLEMKSGKNSYVKTSTNKFIVKGVSIIKLTSSLYNKSESILELEKRNFEEYNASLGFLYSLIREINNVLMYEEGIKNEGIVLNEVLGKSGKGDKYLLVREIPSVKEPNVVYITPDDIRILRDIMSLKGVIS